ncbi:MAG: Ig-like domain-containing protein [Bacteroidia bacterium]
MAVILFSCAQPGSPEGGPVDKIGPKVVETKPEVGAVNVRDDKLVIAFDEFIKKPSYDKEILISPFLQKRPKIGLNGKKLIIRFAEPLDLGVTYVVTLIGIQDYNAGNKMEQAFQLAFSTGANIDSMELKGQVQTPAGEGAKELTVLLFDADSVSGETLPGKRPAYLTQTDAGGYFSLGYLRPGPFRVFAIRDDDGSRSYTPPNEAIALAASPLVQFDSGKTRQVSLFLSLPDQQAPLANNVQWLTDSTLLVGFTEGIRAELLRISLSDSAGNNEKEIVDWVSLVDEIALPTNRPRDSVSLLKLTMLSDSLGNMADTSILLRPRRARLPEDNLLIPPALNRFEQQYEWVFPFIPPPGADSLIVLRDTAEKQVPFHLKIAGLSCLLKPDTALTTGLFYTLEMPGNWWGLKDSTLTFSIKSFDPEGYGSLQGRVHLVDSSGYSGPYVIQLKGPETLTLADTTFDFKLMKPGKYETHILLDADSNGVWTPGSLIPYRLPERTMKGESVDVRANWVFEDYLINAGITPAKTDSTRKQ